MSLLDEIRTALDRESEATPRSFKYVVKARSKEGTVWQMKVEPAPGSRRVTLDEALEGAAGWWPGNPPGTADVLSVDAEREEINLRFATSQPPAEGETLWIYPMRFLEALRETWNHPEWSAKAGKFIDALQSSKISSGFPSPTNEKFPWLRHRQREAFGLPRLSASFLWGPPGTGKTTTLGAIGASLMEQFPGTRICLLSTTNVAVDQALVSIDERLASFGGGNMKLRGEMKRLGNHFVARHYEGRAHLLPSKDEKLLAELGQLEASRPDPQNVVEYDLWKRKVEAVRSQLRRNVRESLKGTRLVALTTTLASFFFEVLVESKFAIVLFDESSQVGLAHAGMLSQLGKRVLFAGDPEQLAPICVSDHVLASKWLGRSMFCFAQDGRANTCFLDEQSRMAQPICRVVSELFYNGRLRVAADKEADRTWRQERLFPASQKAGIQAVHLERITTAGTWSQRYRGPIRHESAKYIVELCKELVPRRCDPGDIIILTPFRAQRALIRAWLRREGLRGIDVLTVHRAQGSERHTVIFDPVQGESDFLDTDDAPRLVNVAMSRAKARLVLTISKSDRENPLFARVAALIETRSGGPAAEGRPVEKLVDLPDFPECCINVTVRIGSVVGKAIRVENAGRYLVVLDQADGQEKMFPVSKLRELSEDDEKE
jgi:hypothetical protein